MTKSEAPIKWKTLKGSDKMCGFATSFISYTENIRKTYISNGCRNGIVGGKVRYGLYKKPMKPICDILPLSMEKSFRVAQLLDKHYDNVCRLFASEGLGIIALVFFFTSLAETLQRNEKAVIMHDESNKHVS